MSCELSRRHVLQSGLAALSAAAVQAPVVASAAAERAPRVDAHLHCFAGSKNARFPYQERGPYKPEQAATPEHLRACMQEGGVEHAIIVHPEPYQDDHRYLEHCLAVCGNKVKGTLLLFADRPASLEKLPELCRKLPVVSVRIHAHSPDRLPPFGKPELKRLWQLATDHGLSVQLHFVPRYAPGFEPLIREFSQTKVIIDHMGRPFQGTASEHAVVLAWSRLNNTVMKLSAIPTPQMQSPSDVAAVVRQLTDAWGADRMIFGDSFGPDTTGESYRQSFERARTLLAHLSAADQDKILGGTASRLFGFAS